MDSITQAALGAAVGEAVLGRKAGGKAAAWGAFFGTLPDLDILAYPFLDPAQELLFHRGPTHALLFSVIVAPLFGLLLSRLHRKDGIAWKGWAWLSFLALFTHPLLDAFTAYGTQLLLPFSNKPVAFNTISIIDPIYTLPLTLGIVVALFFRRDSKGRRRVNGWGLALSSAYLMFTVANKLYVADIFESELDRQRVAYGRLEVLPSLFNNVLWAGLAASEDTVFAGLYSHLDADRHIAFIRIPKNAHLLPPARDGDPLSVLHWFSRGLFTVQSDSTGLVYEDLHVGRTDFYMGRDGESIFTFHLWLGADGYVQGFDVRQPEFEDRSELLALLARRMRGEEANIDSLSRPNRRIDEGMPAPARDPVTGSDP
ncbi:MAG: metal-dependent hydrolase [Rhodothermia bacterium]|nr:metal-dependent hydrolase [Rhodothermia bacterium]